MGSDAVHFWLEQAGRHPLLSAAEEVHLGGMVRAWQDWEPTPDQAPRAIQRRGKRAKDRMVAANLRLVAHVCKRARRGLGVAVPDADVPDLYQAGALGLMRAVERFDPARGYKFSTFAYWWIRQGISRWVDANGRTIRVPTTHAGTAVKAAKVTTALAAKLGRTPTRSELAHGLGISLAELDQFLLIGTGCASLDCEILGADGLALGDLLTAPQEWPDELRDQLLELVAALDEPSRRVICGRYGIGEPALNVTDLARREGLKLHQLRSRLQAAEQQLRRLSGQAAEIASVDPAPTGDGAALVIQPELPWPQAPSLDPGPAAAGDPS